VVLRVLLVEDEALIAIMASMSLEDVGFHVTVASDGQQGLEIALQDRPDVIITDFMMPKMTGLEMIAKLRQNGFSAPIILATAIREKMLPTQEGYDLYISKPYLEEQLIEAVSRFVR
jgi:CheY-like chemotaxis protein